MTIFVFVSLLFVAGITCAVEIKSLEIDTPGTIPCGHVENDPEVRLVQWYKSRRNYIFENGDPSLASWANGITGSLPNYHMENTTFSLVIEKTTLEDEGLYKCSVERGDLYTQSTYYTRTVMYALPRMDPVITMDLDFNRVHCTVEHVKPIIFPVLNFDSIPDITQTYAVLNEDGTYTTSASRTLPQNKSTSRVDCSFSYLHYQRVASLDLRDITTDSLMENKTTAGPLKGTAVTFAGGGRRTTDYTAIIVAGIIIILLIVTNLIVVIKWMKCRKKNKEGVQNKAKESEQKIIPHAIDMVVEVTA